MNHNFSVLLPYLNRVDAVFSDLDGTLLDNEATALDVIGEECLRPIRHLDLAPEVILSFANVRHLAGSSLSSIRHILGLRAGVEIPASAEQAILERRKLSPEPNEKVVQISPVVEFCRFYKEQGGQPMVVTSSERDRASRYIWRGGLGDLIDLQNDLVSAHTDVGAHRHKPHPDCYHLALKLRTTHAARAITFEDTEGGTVAAVGANIAVIGILLGSHIAEYQKQQRAEELFKAGAEEVVLHESEFIPKLLSVLKKMPEPHQAARPQAFSRLGLHVGYNS